MQAFQAAEGVGLTGEVAKVTVDVQGSPCGGRRGADGACPLLQVGQQKQTPRPPALSLAWFAAATASLCRAIALSHGPRAQRNSSMAEDSAIM
jgi:hypothetical protein